MKVDIEALKNVFTYHPPDAERAAIHKGWNKLVIDFVVDAVQYIDDEEAFLSFMQQVQTIRMLGNQVITNRALGLDYRDIFE